MVINRARAGIVLESPDFVQQLSAGHAKTEGLTRSEAMAAILDQSIGISPWERPNTRRHSFLVSRLSSLFGCPDRVRSFLAFIAALPCAMIPDRKLR